MNSGCQKRSMFRADSGTKWSRREIFTSEKKSNVNFVLVRSHIKWELSTRFTLPYNSRATRLGKRVYNDCFLYCQETDSSLRVKKITEIFWKQLTFESSGIYVHTLKVVAQRGSSCQQQERLTVGRNMVQSQRGAIWAEYVCSRKSSTLNYKVGFIFSLYWGRSSVVNASDSNPKTLGSIPWRGKVREAVFLSPRVNSWADLFAPDPHSCVGYGTHPRLYAR